MASFDEQEQMIDVPRLRRELAAAKEINRELEKLKAENFLLRRDHEIMKESLDMANRKISLQHSELVDLYRKLTGNKANL